MTMNFKRKIGKVWKMGNQAFHKNLNFACKRWAFISFKIKLQCNILVGMFFCGVLNRGFRKGIPERKTNGGIAR